ncbi:HK97-gp10 family putative phage morphogenesis protein [Chitinasiproducens palmae]|nr:HK97-gp10 family putative phage morphogenesis protein [Chitinasiproducens palmae]
MTIRNPEELTRVLLQLPAAVSESALRQASAAGARIVLEEARLRAPVGTKRYIRKGKPHIPGLLKREGILMFYREEDSLTGVRSTYGITWSKDAFYGRFVEHGTSRMPAQPHLRPAYDARRTAAAEAVAAVIQEKVREATR